MKQVLVVDQSRTITEGIRGFIANEDRTIFVAHDGATGLTRLLEERPELLILDLELSRAEDHRILRESRRRGWEGSVLILAWHAGLVEPLRGSRLGAFDTLTKPFRLTELGARVDGAIGRTQVARPAVPASADCVRLGEIEVHARERQVFRAGRPVRLSPKEWDLLLALIGRWGAPASRATLLREVWGSREASSSRMVDMHVFGIRRALEEDPGRPRFVLSVRGVGYRVQMQTVRTHAGAVVP